MIAVCQGTSGTQAGGLMVEPALPGMLPWLHPLLRAAPDVQQQLQASSMEPILHEQPGLVPPCPQLPTYRKASPGPALNSPFLPPKVE